MRIISILLNRDIQKRYIQRGNIYKIKIYTEIRYGKNTYTEKEQIVRKDEYKDKTHIRKGYLWTENIYRKERNYKEKIYIKKENMNNTQQNI